MSLDGLLEGYEVTVSIPVAWGDMDAFQHVNNTRYIRWFEDARIAYFERTGIAGSEGLPEEVGPILATVSCRFRVPLTYPDEVRVGARVVEVGEDRFTMRYRVVSVATHQVAATGESVVVAYDYAAGRKATIPEAWRRALSHVEGRDFPGPEKG